MVNNRQFSLAAEIYNYSLQNNNRGDEVTEEKFTAVIFFAVKFSTTKLDNDSGAKLFLRGSISCFLACFGEGLSREECHFALHFITKIEKWHRTLLVYHT